MASIGHAELNTALATIKAKTNKTPTVGIVLGSGLGPLADSVEGADVIPTAEIPHWPRSTVQGHDGQLYLGMLEGQAVMVLRGRSHYYEGHHIQQVTLPIRVMQLMGVETLILTNAAGGLNKSFTAGDLMLINDHINLLGLTGVNPLRGPNDEDLGPRFPSMTDVYTRTLRETAQAVAAEHDIPLHNGVYVGIAGPTFETPAEIRFLRMMGADAVGMSTVAEASVAAHGGLRVMGVSGITNITVDEIDSGLETTHEEVLEAGAIVTPRLETLLRGVLRRLPT